jgi:large subunit ribosomal protein L6
LSRIGKLPIPIPDGVEVKVDGQKVSVKGAKGALSRTMPDKVKVVVEDNVVRCERIGVDKKADAAWGLSRVLVYNMVAGVTQGFAKNLEIVGVGYRAEVKGKDLSLAVGYSNPVMVAPPAGITFKTEGPTKITVEGIDKVLVGQVAADIRAVRPPEPYKGKGIKYAGEQILRKAGKAAGK